MKPVHIFPSFISVLSGLLLSFFLYSGNAHANKQQKLEEIQQEIGQLKNTLATKQKSRQQLQQQLRETELKISKLSQSTRQLQKNINLKNQEIGKLRHKRADHQSQLDRQLNALSNQIYQIYAAGDQPRLRLLLTQKNPAELQRNLVYFDYISRNRLQTVDTVRVRIEQLLQTEKSINEAKAVLDRSFQELDQKKSGLSNSRHHRKSLLTKLDSQILTQSQQLSRLETEAKDLRELINSISKQERFIAELPTKTPFDKQRGKLPWPVKGSLKKLFGRPKPPSRLRWQGVKIQAPTGKQVRAISHGKVAFADWMRGLGNLIIIDHGNGYLSLYGHNESLYKAVGEWVEAGDIISTIGDSGGQNNSALYFEIRKNGKPQNPSKWCGRHFKSLS